MEWRHFAVESPLEKQVGMAAMKMDGVRGTGTRGCVSSSVHVVQARTSLELLPWLANLSKSKDMICRKCSGLVE